MLFGKHSLSAYLTLTVMIALSSNLTLGTDAPSSDDLFRLAVKEARRLKLEQSPAAKTEIDKILYREYLKAELLKQSDRLEPTPKELRQAYERTPMIRLRHLAIMGSKAERDKRIQQVLQEFKSGKAFKNLVLKYSEDHGAKFAGDLDFKGKNDLPPSIYEAALSLKPGTLSGPLELGDATHLIEVISVRSFEKTPEVYKTYLRGRLKRDKELVVLKKGLLELAVREKKTKSTAKGTE